MRKIDSTNSVKVLPISTSRVITILRFGKDNIFLRLGNTMLQISKSRTIQSPRLFFKDLSPEAKLLRRDPEEGRFQESCATSRKEG